MKPQVWLRLVSRRSWPAPPNFGLLQRCEVVVDGEVVANIPISSAKVKFPLGGPVELWIRTPMFEQVFEQVVEE